MPDDPPYPFPVRPELVLEVVADAYGLDLEALTAVGRTKPANEARRVAYQLLHDECRLSWVNVTKIMQRQGRSTASYVAQMAKLADPAAVDQLRARIHLNGNQGSLW